MPLSLALRPLSKVGSTLASAVRVPCGRGGVRPSSAPEKPLELWSCEALLYCRIARETLCELDLPSLLHNAGKHSPSRPAFVARSGRMLVPYLVDPNHDRQMFESADIVRYLQETYGAAAERG